MGEHLGGKMDNIFLGLVWEKNENVRERRGRKNKIRLLMRNTFVQNEQWKFPDDYLKDVTAIH